MNWIQTAQSLACAAALTVAPAFAFSAESLAQGGDGAFAVSRVLMARENLRGRDVGRVTRKLTELGSDAVPDIFQVLVRGRMPIETTDGTTLLKSLETWHRQALSDALTQVPIEVLRGFLAQLAEAEYQLSARVRAAELLQRVGRRRDAALLVQLTTPPEDQRRVPRELREAFEAALLAMADRDPALVGRLGMMFEDVHPSYLVSLVHCAGATESEEGFQQLASMLGGFPQLDSLVMIEMGRIGRGLPQPLDDHTLGRVREYLRHDDVRLVLEAIAAAKSLGDDGAIPDLVAHMRSADRNVRNRAYDALRALTGLRMGQDFTDWDEWLAAEFDWWSNEAPRQIRLVESTSGSKARRAALELARHRLFRRDLGPVLEECLGKRDTELVRIVCAGLGHYGTQSAIPKLAKLLSHSEPLVQQEARRALTRIVGEDLGAEPAAWSTGD
ncbi:MAG: HEAT repeat domain-containing protein [bacterium]|nr:HEAT repeat domain-containing protein [bacterium]